MDSNFDIEVVKVGKRQYRKAVTGAAGSSQSQRAAVSDGDNDEDEGARGGHTRYELADGNYVDYYPGFLSRADADELFELCKYDPDNNTLMQWKQGEVTVGQGEDRRVTAEPRLTTFLGAEDGLEYTYSTKKNITIKWPPLIDSWREACEEACDHAFNAVYANWYSDGRDHISWHADAERDLLPGTGIASISLGETRLFELRHFEEFALLEEQERISRIDKSSRTLAEKKTLEQKCGSSSKNLKVELKHGDLLYMGPFLQKSFRHRVPRSKDPKGPRINLTFRHLKVT